MEGILSPEASPGSLFAATFLAAMLYQAAGRFARYWLISLGASW